MSEHPDDPIKSDGLPEVGQVVGRVAAMDQVDLAVTIINRAIKPGYAGLRDAPLVLGD